jgi:formylglycine-generating enzyme required for sulfatase activity
MKLKFSKKGISEMISVTLLLLVTLLVFISLQNWYFNYSDSNVKNSFEVLNNPLEILLINSSSILIKNHNGVAVQITTLKLEGGECIINETISGNSIQTYSTKICNFEIYQGLEKFSIITPNRIFSGSSLIKSDIIPICNNLIGGDWVYIEANSLLGTEEFCIMKYEAKATTSSLVNLVDSGNMYCGTASTGGSNGCLTDGNVNITSKFEYKPLTHIYQDQAKTLCENLGTGYTLISDLQWVTTAREIESNSLNWFGGSVGTNFIYSGHDDRSPNYSLNATLDDNDPYYRTGDSTVSCDGNSYEYPSSSYDTITGMACVGQKRTLYNKNNEIIWDFSGNVYEWTSTTVSSGVNSSLGQTETPDRWKEWTLITGFDYLESLNNTYNSSNGIGQASIEDTAPFPAGPTHALFRGGNWDRGSKTGIYNLALGGGPTFSDDTLGFRCVYTS